MNFTTNEYTSYMYIGEHTSEDFPFKTKKIFRNVYADYSSKDGRLVGIEILQNIPEKIEVSNGK